MDLNVARRYRFVMMLRRYSLRLCALTVAYALALHGLLVAVAPPAAASAAATCLSGAGMSAPSDQNRDHRNHGQDHGQDRGQDCLRHCLAFHAPDAWAPPVVSVVATFAPSQFDLIALAPAEILARPALDRLQSPRAPPLA